jgi:septum formation protein
MIVLASGSETRARMLRAAGVAFEVERPRLDEAALKAALLAEGVSPRDLADALAEAKAVKVSARRGDALVVGSDQVLACEGAVFGKPATPEEAVEQILALMGRTHSLFAAAVVAQGGRPIWRQVSEARLTMGRLSEPWVRGYVERNWEAVRTSVGGYRIEEEGVRLMARVEGDPFSVLGMPLLPLLHWLGLRGEIAS